MEKGIIVHLDNDPKILTDSKNLFEQTFDYLEMITCTKSAELAVIIETHYRRIRGIIFDIHGVDGIPANEKIVSTDFLPDIENSYSSLNVPIFVYSGYLYSLPSDFARRGTVFLHDKGNGLELVFALISKLHSSGFIEVFCPEGLLETKIIREFHRSFTKQFHSSEQLLGVLDSIANSVSSEKPNTRERVQEVFSRISVRSLLSSLLAEQFLDLDSNLERKINPIECYLQRVNEIPVWTGDIFKDLGTGGIYVVVTPRCDLVRFEKSPTILMCEIESFKFEKKTMDRVANNNPQFANHDYILMASPVFQGGYVRFRKTVLVARPILIDLTKYERLVSLSEDIANEMLGRFGAYFFRSGITPIDSNEAIALLPPTDNIKDGKK